MVQDLHALLPRGLRDVTLEECALGGPRRPALGDGVLPGVDRLGDRRPRDGVLRHALDRRHGRHALALAAIQRVGFGGQHLELFVTVDRGNALFLEAPVAQDVAEHIAHALVGDALDRRLAGLEVDERHDERVARVEAEHIGRQVRVHPALAAVDPGDTGARQPAQDFGAAIHFDQRVAVELHRRQRRILLAGHLPEAQEAERAVTLVGVELRGNLAHDLVAHGLVLGRAALAQLGQRLGGEPGRGRVARLGHARAVGLELGDADAHCLGILVKRPLVHAVGRSLDLLFAREHAVHDTADLVGERHVELGNGLVDRDQP